jgi:hypothetical protein
MQSKPHEEGLRLWEPQPSGRCFDLDFNSD